MHIAGHSFEVMTHSEMEMIHQGVMRILGEMGMEIQNQKLLAVCAEYGCSVDFDRQRVRFPVAIVEQFLERVDKVNWDKVRPEISATAGVYHSFYHEPNTQRLLPWNEEFLINYFKLARSLPNVGSADMLGCRLPVPSPLEPLYERYYCWKYGAQAGGSIYIDGICPYLLDIYQAYADSLRQPLPDTFHATVYLIPAMKLGIHEAYQVQYFWERDLRVGIGDMFAMGATVPVTVAGAVTLNVAERIALGILNAALYGQYQFHLGVSIAPMDMRTMIYPFGRPESIIANLMTAQLSRYYQVSYSGHAGLTSAKLPSVEAGCQKASSAIATLMVGGNLWMDAGLLAMDEVVSPIQMVLDNEYLGFLKRFCKEYAIDQDSLAIETILAVGPGGTYIDKSHTARFFRNEIWEPSIWSRGMLNAWKDSGMQLDIDKARAIVIDNQSKTDPYPGIDNTLEKEILAIIGRAKSALCS